MKRWNGMETITTVTSKRVRSQIERDSDFDDFTDDEVIVPEAEVETFWVIDHIYESILNHKPANPLDLPGMFNGHQGI